MDQSMIDAVWGKATIKDAADKDEMRFDENDYAIMKSKLGLDEVYGWKIAMIDPYGGNMVENLKPLNIKFS